MLSVTFRQLEVLVEVARSGSFRRCGEKLGLSQVSVSEHVRSLEERLGVPLFERRPGAAPVLTDKGRIALGRAEQALAIVSDLIAETSPAVGGRRLRVAVSSFLMGELPPILDRFGREYPLVALEIDTDPYFPEEIANRIQRKVIDLAFFFALADAAPAGSRHLRDERLAIFVGADHPLATRISVTLAELAAEPIVRLTERNPLGELVAQALARAGIAQPRVALATDDFGLIVRSVRSGHGYACMFEASAEDCRQMGLVRVELDASLPSLQALLLVRPSLEKEKVAADLVDRVTEVWTRKPESGIRS